MEFVKFEFFASEFEAIDDYLYVGFASSNEGEHYVLITRDEKSTEEALPNRKNIYIELDDESWTEDVGVDRVTLCRNQLTICMGSDTKKFLEYDEILIAFSLDDTDFKKLQDTLQKIMRGYEDRLEIDLKL